MKKNLLSVLMIAGAFMINAQVETETVSVGPSSANDVWYSLENGTLGTAPSGDWNVAFQVGGLADASILVNIVNGTAVYEYPGDIEDWDNVDTTGMDWEALYNSSTSWKTGAFNQIKDESNQFDYGWGEYNMSTHSVIGAAIFIVKLDNATYKKFKIDELGDSGSTYYFSYADLDGSNEVSEEISKDDHTGYNFAYYSLEDEAVVAREPGDLDSWDILFTSYMDLAENPIDGGFEIHKVSGVLSSPKIKVAQVDDVDVDTYVDWMSGDYSTDINTIGYDWKEFNMDTYQYEIAEDRVYFVKTDDGSIWKLVFTDYAGAATGDMTFTKELMTTLSVGQNEMQNPEVIVYPNPASSQVSLVLSNMNAQSTDISIIDMQGNIVYNNTVNGSSDFEVKNISVDQLQAGIYMVNIVNGNQNVTQKLIIK